MAAAKKVFARNDDRPSCHGSRAGLRIGLLVFRLEGRALPPVDVRRALIGQLAHRRLTTDDGVTADEVADIVVPFSLNGLRPRES
jgi:hypothetical protein